MTEEITQWVKKVWPSMTYGPLTKQGYGAFTAIGWTVAWDDKSIISWNPDPMRALELAYRSEAP